MNLSIQDVTTSYPINLSENVNNSYEPTNETIIKCDIRYGIRIAEENIKDGYNQPSRNANIEDFKKILELLDSDIIDKSKLAIIDEFNESFGYCGGHHFCGYTVAYNNIKLFTTIEITKRINFKVELSSGNDFKVKFNDGFNELYYMPHAPGYYKAFNQFTKND